MRKCIVSIMLSIVLGSPVFGQIAGNALHYNVTNGYVSASLPPVFNNIATNDFTIETWLSVSNSATSKRVFFAQFSTGNFVSILINSSNIPYVFIMDGGTTYSANTQTPLISGQWNHFATTWDASSNTLACYINGVQVSFIAGGGSSTGIDNSMTIGSRTDGAQIFNGALDNLRIWSDIRTECEIYGSMNTEFTVAQPNLVASYSFNSGVANANNAGVTTLEELNNNFDGTLNGFTLDGTSSNWVNSGAGVYTQNSNDGIAYLTDTEEACESYTWINGTTYTSSVSGVTYLHNSVSGCPINSTLNLTIHGLPAVNGGTDQTVCEGESVTLSGSGASSYTWDNGVTDNLAFVPASTGSYVVSGTDGNGCINTDEVVVTVNNLPNVNAGPDQTVCAGNSATFSGSGAANYSWNNGITDNMPFTATTAGAYIVEGTDVNGCINIDTALLFINELPIVNAGSDQTVCAGTTVTLIGSGDPATYTWNNGVTDNIPFTPSTTADYIVTGNDVNGCNNADTLTITVNLPPDVTVTQTDLTLHTSPASAYQWINCDTGDDIPGETNQSFIVTTNGNYAVIATSTDGCADTSLCTLINYLGSSNFANADFQIYPNPARDFFTIDQLDPTLTTFIILYDASGKIISTESVNSSAVTISTSNLNRGIYFISVQSEDKIYAVQIILN